VITGFKGPAMLKAINNRIIYLPLSQKIIRQIKRIKSKYMPTPIPTAQHPHFDTFMLYASEAEGLEIATQTAAAAEKAAEVKVSASAATKATEGATATEEALTHALPPTEEYQAATRLAESENAAAKLAASIQRQTRRAIERQAEWYTKLASDPYTHHLLGVAKQLMLSDAQIEEIVRYTATKLAAIPELANVVHEIDVAHLLCTEIKKAWGTPEIFINGSHTRKALRILRKHPILIEMEEIARAELSEIGKIAYDKGYRAYKVNIKDKLGKTTRKSAKTKTYFRGSPKQMIDDVLESLRDGVVHNKLTPTIYKRVNDAGLEIRGLTSDGLEIISTIDRNTKISITSFPNMVKELK
jgi:hypothetical protein